jgi:outer membrane murein-binding lipoprotein Lpp
MTTPRGHVRPRPLRRLTPWLATAVICGVMVTGCATLPGSPHATPVSPEAYQTGLRADGDALKAAVDGIGATPPLQPLESQVDSAASAVRAAAQRLTTIVPPTQYAAAQANLVSALDQLASQLSELGTQVQSRNLCAAPSVMATLSSLPGADALRRAAPTLGSAGADLAAALPAPEPLPDRRENNGTVLRAPGSGSGEITAENVPDHDTVVTLSQDGRAIGSFYVARGETAQMDNIPDGTYDIFFTSGADWDGNEFTRSCTFQRFDKTATFTTTETPHKITYTKLTVILYPTVNGNSQTVNVPPDSFPK